MELRVLVLAATDLWYLFYLKSPAIIVGFSNPLRGYLKKDIEEFKLKKRKQLIDNGVLEETLNGLYINDRFDQIVTDIAHSEHAALIACKQQERTQNLSLHFVENRITQFVQIDQETYQIENLDSLADFIDQITGGLANESSNFGTPFVQKTILLEKLRSTDPKPSAADIRDEINKWDLEDKIVEILVDILASPIIMLSFLLYRNKNIPNKMNIDGFALLANQENTLLIEPIGKEGVNSRLSLKNREEVRSKMAAIFEMS